MRTLRTTPWAAAALVLALAACERREPAPAETARSPAGDPLTSDEQARVVAQAAAAITPFKQQLSAALTKALQQGGPLQAIEVCAETAPRLAAQASSEQTQVGRSALRLRNPSNAPREWLKPLLADLAKLDSAQGAQRVAKLSNGRYGYAEAIVLQPQCALCHGTSVAAPIAEAIRARYPNDQAMGFEPGQLRGVFWAELALANP